MPYTTYNCDALTGGAARALDSYSVSVLTTGNRAFVDESGETLRFKYNSAGTAAENVSTHPYVVRPDDYSVGGNWEEQIAADRGDVSAAAALTANALIVGDDGAKGVKTAPGNVVVDSAGNVGIGTTLPGAKLDVNGIIRAYTAVTGIARIRIEGVGAIYDILADDDPNQMRINTPTVDSALVLNNNGNVGIGTMVPGNKLAVNIATDGTLQDFEVADAVQGNITVATGTVSYNAFCGSHYTQLKEGQKELPVGAVVVSTGEIVPCEANITEIEETKTEVALIDSFEKVDVEIDLLEDKEIDGKIQKAKKRIGEEFKEYRLVNNKIEKIMQPVYAKTTIQKTQLKANYSLDPQTGKIYKTETIKKMVSQDVSNKEYFPYIDTTTIAGDKRVYGVWFSKMSDDAKGAAFGQDSKPVYLIAQVGLFKIRVTDTNGNIKVGDFLETSTRPMEAQKQVSKQKETGTIAKAMVDVDFSKVDIDPVLGYRWKLIPCIF